MHGFWVGPAAGNDAPAASLDLVEDVGGDAGWQLDLALAAAVPIPDRRPCRREAARQRG